MELDGKPRPVAPSRGKNSRLTILVEGDPKKMCRRHIYGVVDGLVLWHVVITSLGQDICAPFLRDVADEFAARETGIVFGHR